MWAQGAILKSVRRYGSPDPLFTFLSLLILLIIVLCAPSLSQDFSAKLAKPPYEDDSVRALPASHRTISEGHNASLVREFAGSLSVLPVSNALHVCLNPPDNHIVSALTIVPLPSSLLQDTTVNTPLRHPQQQFPPLPA